jgi:signal transduction histidine kinase/ligand-binding sensor domain-containing protein
MKIMHRFYTLLVVISFCITDQLAIGQPSATWREWSIENGLTHTVSRVIRVGESGRIYISPLTGDEMNVYDGYSMIRIPTPQRENEVYEDLHGNLWAPYSIDFQLSGVQKYEKSFHNTDKKEWTIFEIDEVINTDFHDTPYIRDDSDYRYHKYGKILPLRNNRILILLPHKLIEFNSDTQVTRTVLQVHDTQLDRFNEMAPSMDGNIWILGHYNIIIINRDDIEQYTHPDCKPYLDTPIDKNYYFMRMAGQFAQIPFENVNNELFIPTISIQDQAMFQAHLKNGSLQWIKPRFGKNVINGVNGINQTYWVTEWSQTGEGYTQIHYDKNGHILFHINKYQWLSAAEPNGVFWTREHAGIARHSPALWRAKTEEDLNVLAHCIDTQGRIWLTTLLSLYCYDKGEWKGPYHYPKEHFPPELFRGTSHIIHTMAILQDGSILIPTFSHFLLLFKPSTEQFEIINHPDRTRKFGEFVCQRNKGTAWVISTATDQMTLSPFRIEIYDGKNIKPLLPNNNECELGRIHNIIETKSGEIWIASNKGIAVYDEETLDVITHPSGYPGKSALALIELQNNHIWAGDVTTLYEYDGETWKTVRGGFQYINFMYQSSNGDVWINTTTGVYRYHKNTWRQYTDKDGLGNSSTIFTFESPDKRIWISAGNVFCFHPESDTDIPTGIISEKENLRKIAPDGNALIVYSGIDKWNYTKKDNLLFRYRIDDNNWSEYQSDTYAYLTAIPSGNHQFELQVMDQNFNLSFPVFWNFEVLYPWYQQPVFLFTISIAGLIIIILSAFHISNYFNLAHLVEERTKHLTLQQKRLKTLATELTATEDKERRKLATDLHDRIGQSLALCHVQLESMRSSLQAETIENNLSTLQENIQQTIQDTHSLTFELCPPILHDLGLKPTIDWLAESFQQQHNLEFLITSKGEIEPLPEDIRTFLFRSIREIAINCIKHAHATSILISIVRNNDGLRVMIEDDGKGIESEKLERLESPTYTGKKGGFGLFSIRERLNILDGTLEIESHPNEGTRMVIKLPSHSIQGKNQ